MIADLSRFIPLSIADREEFTTLVERSRTMCSHYNFAALYCWQDEYQTRWQRLGDHLLVYNGSMDILLSPPGPGVEGNDLIRLSRSMQEQNLSGRIGMVPPALVRDFPVLEEYFFLKRDDDNADYIYSSTRLAELPGRKLARKRNQIHQFLDTYPDAACREIDPGNWLQCRSLAEKWSRAQLGMALEKSPEFRALQRAFPHCHELGLHGFGLYIGDRLTAFTIWSRQTERTATIHFEKFDPDVKGTSQLINRETARHLSSWAHWINREQDLGIPGLRRAKRSYLPERLLWGYLAQPRYGSHPQKGEPSPY